MTKTKRCKVCGNLSGKRNVCKECKEKYPYKAASAEGGRPFNRQFEYYKDNLKRQIKEEKNKQ